MMLGFIFIFASCSLILWSRLNRPSLPYPPGPPREWIFGNARQTPTEKQWLTFAAWTERYGGYIFLKIFHTPYLVINSATAALDLLEKRSSIYSDRPISTMATELIGWDFTTALIPYNNLWRKHRKFLHQHLNICNLENHRNIQTDEIHKFLPRVQNDPNNIIADVKRLTGSIIMRMAYGYELQKDDRFVELVESSVEGLTATFGVGFFVDIIPILKYIPEWFPGASFKRLAREWRTSTLDVVELPWAALKEKYLQGVASFCYCSALLDANGGAQCDSATEIVIKHSAATLYAAGSDSTSSLISSFILAMTLYPEIQKQAQDEIDRIIGSDRLPTFEDRAKLPYLECVIREIYRWNPASPLAVAHKLMRDDEYEGYLIPAGTVVIPNIWAMCHDPKMYPDPMIFDPARFLNLTAEESKSKDPSNFVFGFGRRICAGLTFGDNVVFLAVASILTCFNIRKSVLNGKEITPEVEYPHFVGHPKSFQCDVILRSLEADALIAATASRAA